MWLVRLVVLINWVSEIYEHITKYVVITSICFVREHLKLTCLKKTDCRVVIFATVGRP